MLLTLQKAIEAHLEEYHDVEEDSLYAQHVRVEFYYGDTSLCVQMSKE